MQTIFADNEMKDRLDKKSEPNRRKQYFPLFIDSSRKTVTVIGGGRIAARRVSTLARFSFRIIVVAPDITPELRERTERKEIEYVESLYAPKYLPGSDIVLACTNDEAVNRRIGADCRRLGIAYNNCSDRNDSDFWFPAIMENPGLTAGMIGTGRNHHAVSRAAADIQAYMRKISEEEE